MKIKGFLSTCLLSLFLSGSISNAEILVGYAAPSLDGAQAQIQNGFLVGAEKNGWKVLSVTSGGDAQNYVKTWGELCAQNRSRSERQQWHAIPVNQKNNK